MRKGDIGSALALSALGAFVIYHTGGYPSSMARGAPGPAFFPRLLAGAILVLSLLLIVQAVRSTEKTESPAAEPPSLGRLARSGAALVMTIAFLLVVEQVDFFLLLLPLLAGIMAIMGERSVRVLTLVPVGFVAFVYIVFFRLFGVPFPTIL